LADFFPPRLPGGRHRFTKTIIKIFLKKETHKFFLLVIFSLDCWSVEFDLVDIWSILFILSVPFSVWIRFPLSNFVFFFAEPDASFGWCGSRNDRRFCWRTEARRLPVAVAGGEVKIFVEGVKRSYRRDDEGGKNGIWNDWWDTEELSIVSSFTCNGYWCGCSRLKKTEDTN
jgi:hypothetical protein